MPTGINVVAQLGQKHIGTGSLGAKSQGRFAQALSNALAQLGGGGFGEGHDQDLRRQQGCPQSRLGLNGVAQAQDQAQVQGAQGPGFARARAGFDHLPPVQGQRQWVQCRGWVHAASAGWWRVNTKSASKGP